MASRHLLHKEIEKIFPNIKVYYQPPSKLSYPCIVYDLDDIDILKANDHLYKKDRKYTLTYFSLVPDPTIKTDNGEMLIEDILLNLPYCTFDRHYTSDGIHHYVYTIYY